jgi:DNA-binding beta-propeller fold protein YncE
MRRRSTVLLLTLVALTLLGLAGAGFVAGTPVRMGAQEDGGTLVPTNQELTPAGLVRRTEGSRPKDLALSPDGTLAAVLTTSRVLLYGMDGALRGNVALSAGALGIAWAPDGRTLYASGGSGRIYRITAPDGDWAKAENTPFSIEAPGARPGARQAGNPQPNGMAVSPDGKSLYVALGIRNAVAVVDLPEMTTAALIPVGVAPYHLALSRDGRTLCAANLGGRHAGMEELTEPSAGTGVRVDRETDVPVEGSVSLIDTASQRVREVVVGRQPAGMALSTDGGTLYVANSSDDTVSVVDVEEGRVQRSFSLRPDDDRGFGQMPNALALSGDEKTLYTACAGANAVAVVNVDRRPRVRGYVPTAWFPIAVAEREGRLVVASAKGFGARPERPGKALSIFMHTGTVQLLTADDRRDLKRLTRQVAANNHWSEEPPARAERRPVPVPARVGEPSVFKHVVYILKENHTYDSTLGDMAEGNGDRSLTLFGEEITPNQHALAREFVLLDNTYASGTVSADGHQWTDSAVANAYSEQNFGANARSYPYDGGDPLAYSPEGFLWTAARKRGHSVRVYGEFVNRPKITDTQGGRGPTWSDLWHDYQEGTGRYRITAETDSVGLRPMLHPNVVGFPLTVSDQWRASEFLNEFAGFERSGEMPGLCMLLLPCDHTSGTRAGMPTPRAAVADNDLAVGRIVEAISKSRFWKDTLILIIEDDTQLGLDHVDGHRTMAFCVSPYTRRGAVVSEPYNHTSVVRTIGLVLGLPALTRFDRTATPLTACFTSTPDERPFARRPNGVPLDELNPPATALRGEARRWAEASARLDWSDVDRADATTVARAVWQSRRPGQPFPWRSFHPNRDADD